MTQKLETQLTRKPEPQTGSDHLRHIAAASAFFNSISIHVGPGHSTMFDDDIRQEMVSELSEKWLTRHARDIFPAIDEFQLEDGWVINHPDHDEREEHKRFTLQQLYAWIDTQQHNLI
jgi:hypothetical protein